MTTPPLRRTVDLRRPRVHGPEGGDPHDHHPAPPDARTDHGGRRHPDRRRPRPRLRRPHHGRLRARRARPTPSHQPGRARSSPSTPTTARPAKYDRRPDRVARAPAASSPFVAMMTARVRGPASRATCSPRPARMAATVYVVALPRPGQAAGAAALWLGAPRHGGRRASSALERPAGLQLLHRAAAACRLPRRGRDRRPRDHAPPGPVDVVVGGRDRGRARGRRRGGPDRAGRHRLAAGTGLDRRGLGRRCCGAPSGRPTGRQPLTGLPRDATLRQDAGMITPPDGCGSLCSGRPRSARRPRPPPRPSSPCARASARSRRASPTSFVDRRLLRGRRADPDQPARASRSAARC